MSKNEEAANQYIERFCNEFEINPAPWFKEIMRRELVDLLYAAQHSVDPDGASSLPESIQEALNSGDGTYRP